MNNHNKLLLLLLTILTSAAVAQDSLINKNFFIIKTDIALPIIGLATNTRTGTLSVEFCTKHRHSIQLTGLISNFKTTEIQLSSIQAIPAYKYFLSGRKNCNGLYTGIYIKANTDHRKVLVIPQFEFKQTMLGGGLILGYQRYIKKRFAIDVLFGLGTRQVLYTKVIKAGDVSIGTLRKTFKDGILALNVGYRF